jgi:hypothetical protein
MPSGVGFRDVTLVGRRGTVLAYASQVAVRSSTIGLSGVTLAASALPRLLRGVRVTLYASGRPRVTLTGLRLAFPLGEHPLPEGGWACDMAIGMFRRLSHIRTSRSHPRPR